MNQFDISYPQTSDQLVAAQNTLIRQIYAWMGAGLFLTALMAVVTLSSPSLLQAITELPPGVLDGM